MRQRRAEICDQKVWKLIKFTVEWHFSVNVAVWTSDKLATLLKDSEEWGGLPSTTSLCGYEMYYVLRLRSRSISVSGTTDEWIMIRFYPKRVSVISRSCTRMTEARNDFFLWWNSRRCEPLRKLNCNLWRVHKKWRLFTSTVLLKFRMIFDLPSC